MRARFFAVLAAMLLVGCTVSRNDFQPEKPSQQVNLKGSSLYVYCFLDMHADDIGRPVLASFDALLVQRLSAEGVKTMMRHYSQVPPGYTPVFANSRAVPVDRMIDDNRPDERNFGTQYRLVIYPTGRSATDPGPWGSNFKYEINWKLYDAENDDLLWSVDSIGVHANVYTKEHHPEERAKIIVDSFIAELQKNDMLPKPAAPPSGHGGQHQNR